MKKILLLLLSGALAISAADASRVNRNMLAGLERTVDDRIRGLWNDNTMAILGNTRGVYIPGTGIVLSAETNVATANLSLMVQTLTKEELAALHKKKLERIPQLEKAMQDTLATMSGTLDTLPAGEKIAIALVLPRYSFEDPTGLPLQVTIQMERGQGAPEVTVKPTPDAKVMPGKLTVAQPQVPTMGKVAPVFSHSEVF
jgi:hypothetical protein